MPVLIDGNNLLYAARDAEPTDRLVGRSMLCDTLGAWARRRRERVQVVFDGPPPNASLAEQIGHADIQVVYSGAGVSADTVIIDSVARDSAPRRLVVVSTDRAIARAARSRRAVPVRADAFWKQVQAELARPEPRPQEPKEKTQGLDPTATDTWLAEFGLQVPPEDQDGPSADDPDSGPSRRQ